MKNPSVDAEFVLKHQGYVNRLARGLVFDEAGADDLAQQVWLAAIEHPPAHASGLRGWLATIARNLASGSRRNAARRDERERVAARGEAVAAADELIAREALRTKLVQSVLALEEPFREAIILRYFDELSPRAIASKQSVSVATVKSRLKRGLATLRERLDREGGGRAAWSLALVNGLHLGPGAASVAAFSAKSLASGVVLMTATKKIALAAALVVACFLTWKVATPGSPLPSVEPGEIEAAQNAAVETPPPATSAPANESSRERVSHTIRGKRVVPPPPVGSGPGDLDVRVELRKGHVPLTDVAVIVTPLDQANLLRNDISPGFETRVARTDATGQAHFAQLAPGDVQIAIDRGFSCFGLVASGVTRSVTLAVEGSCDVSGRVIDPAGQAVDAAQVWLVDLHDPANAFQVATTPADGRFEIHGVKPSTLKVFAVKPGFASSARKFVRVNEGGKFVVELALRGAGASIDGIVHNARGEPVADAMILVGNRSDREAAASLTSRPTIIEGMPARSDERGHFALEGLLPGPAWIECSALGSSRTREAVELSADTVLHHDVVLHEGATLRGIVLRADGSPAREAVVTVGDIGAQSAETTTTDAVGAYCLRGLEAGEAHVTAEYSDVERVQGALVLQAGVESNWSPKLERGLELAVRVIDEAGKPTTKVGVRAECQLQGGATLVRGGMAQKDGSFKIQGCPDAPCTITVFPEHSQMFAIATVRDVRPGGPPVVVNIDAEARPSIYFTGRVVGPDGKSLAACTLTPMNAALDYAAGELSKDDGSFRIGPFPAGRWSLEVAHEGLVSFNAKERELSAGATWDLGTVQLAGGDAIEIELIYPDEPEHFPPWITVHGLDSGSGDWCKIEGDRGRTPPLAPGRYELRVEGAYAAFRARTEVIAGRVNKVTLELKSGIAFAIQLSGAEPGVHTELTLLDSAGTLVMEHSPRLNQVGAFKFPLRLAAGHYRIEVLNGRQRKASLEFDVDASTAGKTIEVELR